MTILLTVLFLARGEVVDLELKGAPSKPVRGELVRENLKGIVLARPEGAVLYPWAALSRVNGSPALERRNRVRLASAASFCPDCRGGLVAHACPDCLGTSTVFGQSRPCPDCAGRGVGPERCAGDACEKGFRPCPGTCLKRGVGIWTSQAGTAGARSFHFRAGTGGATAVSYLSEKHLGRLFEFRETKPFPLSDCARCFGTDQGPCDRCRRSGTFVEAAPLPKGDCPDCGGPGSGAGRIACAACFGTGERPCGACLGAGAVPVRESVATCATCRKGVVACATCSDTGLVDPKAPLPPGREDLRRALARVEDGPAAAAERVTFLDGRALEGVGLASGKGGFVFLTGSGTELRVCTIRTNRGFRREGLPETVLLKDGTSVRGRIVARTDRLVMVRTPEGETVKIEAGRVAEIRPPK